MSDNPSSTIGADAAAALDPLAHVDQARSEALRDELTQRQINALMAHGRMVSEQIAELTRRVLTVEHQQVAADLQMKTVLTELKGNTEITSQIRDLLTAGRVAKQAGDGLSWMVTFGAKLGIACAAVWGAFQALAHLMGPKP